MVSNNSEAIRTELINSGADLLDTLIDTFAVEELKSLESIPVAGTLVKIVNTYSKVKALMFTRKIHSFFYEFDQEKWKKLKKSIEKRTRDDIGVSVISVIESVERLTQAKMVGTATNQYIYSLERGENNKSDFDYNIYVIKNLDEYLLSALHSIYGEQPSSDFIHVDQALFNLGLVEQEKKASFISETHPTISFVPSYRGEKFYNDIIVFSGRSAN